MKTIWLINPYGPIEGENWREYSFNQFGKFLSANGFHVIWWTASFSHHFKKYRSDGWKDIGVNKNYIIRLVPTNSYKKNISIGRFRKDIVFGRNVLERVKKEEKPDIILAAENPMCMGKPGYEYAKENHVPIIYDQMDIWPEFLVNVLPTPVDKIANLLLWRVYKKRKTIYENLDGAIALGKHYLDFMFEVSSSLRNKPNALVYNGIDVEAFRSHLAEPIKHEKVPKQKTDNEVWCVFAGTLGPSYDIEGIIGAATKLEEENIKFFIAGSGPKEEIVKDAEQRLSNLFYLGKLLPEELIPVYGKCDIGLSAYSAGSNVDMCDKFYDYTAAGLVVINSLTGEVSEHIRDKELGENYQAGNEEELKKAIKKYTNHGYLQRIKANSYNAGTLFDMKNQNEKLLNIINQVLDGENR